MMDAVIAGEEQRVDPSPEFLRTTLARLGGEPDEHDRFICLIRDGDDQLNALWTEGAWVMEWYRGDAGGHCAGFRTGQAPAEIPRRRGFLTRLFRGPEPLRGSRVSLNEAATMLMAYANGAETFAGWEWIPIR